LRRGLLAAAWALLAAAAGAQPLVVRFEADLRAEAAAGRFDPARDRVELRGGFAPLSWHQGLPMQALAAPDEGRWAVTVSFARRPAGDQPVPHKFRIVRAAHQGPDEGWEPGANHAAAVDTPAPVVARVFGSQAAPAPTRLTGTIVTLEPWPAGHALARPVWVWLPPGYERDTQRRYPVLYLHDGQNMFDARGAGAEWQVDETAQRLVSSGAVAPFIVVAVPSGRERVRELTPTPGGRGGGHLPAYGRWLLDELKPEVDRRFRTRPEAESTSVGGSSLGGVASLWLALNRADRIGAALVVSPSVWWDGFLPRRDVMATPPPVPRPRLWLDMGAHEGEGVFLESRALRDALQSRGWSGETLSYTEDPEGRHDELSWALRVDGMLKFLFPPTLEIRR
jgi:predicted alpha/beta superfamily hydrolase